MIQTEDWAVFEATTSGIEESKGNHQHRISSTDSSTSNAAPLRVKQAKAARSKYTNDGIDEKNVTPLIAFEMFAGKSFTTKRDMASTDLSDSVSKGSSSSSSVESATITTTTSNDTSSVIHNPKGRTTNNATITNNITNSTTNTTTNSTGGSNPSPSSSTTPSTSPARSCRM